MNKKLISLATISTLALSNLAFSANGYTSSTVPVQVPPVQQQGQNGYSSVQTPPAVNHPAPAPQAGHIPNGKPRHGYSSSQTPPRHGNRNYDRRHYDRHDRGVEFYAAVPGFVGGVVLGGDSYFVPEHAVPPGLTWVNRVAGSPLPFNSVIGGDENGHPLFICHANYQGGTHPGKIVNGRCNITYGGREIAFNRFQVLIAHGQLAWLPAGNGSVPPSPIAGGGENGHPLYICQAGYAGGVHPGKLVGQACNIGYDGREISIPFYNVLVA